MQENIENALPKEHTNVNTWLPKPDPEFRILNWITIEILPKIIYGDVIRSIFIDC
jgi:hypothetical protein